MAIPKGTVSKLEEEFKRAYDDAMYYGDTRLAAQIRTEHQRVMNENAYQNIYGNMSGQGISSQDIYGNQAGGLSPSQYAAHTAQINTALGQMKEVTPYKPPLGVLLFNSTKKEVPQDWRGPEIDAFKRGRHDNGTYAVAFTSKWGNVDIVMFISSEEHSGKEADEMAKTFMEVLNQRRVG